MRRITGSYVAALLAVLPWCSVHAVEGEVPMPLVLRHAGSDPVGFALAAAVSQALSTTPELRMVADTASPRIVLVIATVDGSVEDPGKQTAASINALYDADALPLNGYLITGLVQVCGITRTDACAQEIVSALASAIARLRVNNPDLWLALQPQP